MASTYSGRHSKPLGVSAEGWAGAGRNLGIEALAGDTDLVTVFDDFNDVLVEQEFGSAEGFENMGWVLSDVGAPAGDDIGMNSVGLTRFTSCIEIDAGTGADTGGNAQLDWVNATAIGDGLAGETFNKHDFPHIYLADSGVNTSLDRTIAIFACRIGLVTDDAAGDWDGKAFIGFAEAGDAGIMTAATGAITLAATGPMTGFHIPEDGSIDAIGIRDETITTAVDGTHFTELLAAGAVDSTVLNGAAAFGDTMWFDLAFRMTITDMSNDTGNGATEFFHRRVPPTTGPAGDRADQLPGEGTAWTRHPTALLNQTPNNAVLLVPTIEVINGPTDESGFLLDWWAMGISRFSRR